jgi:uncharacterized protein YgiM (DUF1202 family)
MLTKKIDNSREREEKMNIKAIIMITVIAFAFGCGLTEKFGKKEEPATAEIQQEQALTEEPTYPPAAERVQPAPEPAPPTVFVVASVVNIRTGPGMKSKVVTTVRKGDELELLGEEGSWCNVRLSNGMEGWIYKKLVR